MTQIVSLDFRFRVGNCDLIFYTERQEDGTWALTIDALVTWRYEYPHVGTGEDMKTPSPELQRLVRQALGVETTLEPDEHCPSLVGQFPSQPDPNELIGKIEAMLADADGDTLW